MRRQEYQQSDSKRRGQMNSRRTQRDQKTASDNYYGRQEQSSPWQDYERQEQSSPWQDYERDETPIWENESLSSRRFASEDQLQAANDMDDRTFSAPHYRKERYSERNLNQSYGNNKPSREYNRQADIQGYAMRQEDTDERTYSPQRFGSTPGTSSSTSFRGKGPKGYSRSDERIREDVCEALEYDDRVDASPIEVNVKDGVVTLSGFVETRQAKRLAEECIEQVRGVKDINNSLQVQQSPTASRTEKSSPGLSSDEDSRLASKSRKMM